MRNRPSEDNLGFGFGARALIFSLLAAGCTPSPTPHVQWGPDVEGHEGHSTCDAECEALSHEQGTQDRLDVGLPRDLHGELLVCGAAFGPDGQPIPFNVPTASGKGWCVTPSGEAECDPEALPVRFVPAPTAPDGGAVPRTTGFALCNERNEDCVSAQHGGGTPAGCEEDLGLFPGDQAGANCRERCQ